MSYNTRRSGNFGPGTPQGQAQSVGSIGQRRPVVTNNFVPGGQIQSHHDKSIQKGPQFSTRNQSQMSKLNAQKAGVQTPQQQRPPNQTANTTVNFRNQNQGYQTQPPQQQVQPQQQHPVQQQQQHPVQQQQPHPVQQQQPHPVQQQQQHPVQQQHQQPQLQQVQHQQQQQVQQPLQVQQPPQVQQQKQVKIEQQSIIAGINPPNPALENANGEGMDVDLSDTPKKKPFWAKGGKISKKEKMRRRNVRLSKVLQPKNAVMILNELVKNTSYAVEEVLNRTDMNQFKASVLVEDIEHVGYGRSKIHAKNSAAEAALRHLIKTNKLSEMKKDEDGNEKMDVSEDGTQPPLPWQHIASLALYKLFTSWGEDPNKAPNVQQQLNISGVEGPKHHENRPAKKMPINPDTMNPLMLINQMLPHALFEEIGKSGAPPNVIYSYRCTVDGLSFIGTGSNKKAAKKLAAFGACHKILNVIYPKDVYVPIY